MGRNAGALHQPSEPGRGAAVMGDSEADSGCPAGGLRSRAAAVDSSPCSPRINKRTVCGTGRGARGRGRSGATIGQRLLSRGRGRGGKRSVCDGRPVVCDDLVTSGDSVSVQDLSHLVKNKANGYEDSPVPGNNRLEDPEEGALSNLDSMLKTRSRTPRGDRQWNSGADSPTARSNHSSTVTARHASLSEALRTPGPEGEPMKATGSAEVGLVDTSLTTTSKRLAVLVPRVSSSGTAGSPLSATQPTITDSSCSVAKASSGSDTAVAPGVRRRTERLAGQKDHVRRVLAGIAAPRAKEKSADIVFICGEEGRRVYAHSGLLGLVSPLVRTWRESWPPHSDLVITLQDVDFATAGKCVELLYKGKTTVSGDCADKLAALFTMLAIDIKLTKENRAAPSPRAAPDSKSPGRKSLEKPAVFRPAEDRRSVAKVLEDKVLAISNEAANSFCYCNAPSSKNLIGCDYCPQWYHPRCLGLTEEETIQVLKLSTWRCPECLKGSGKVGAAATAPTSPVKARSVTLGSPRKRGTSEECLPGSKKLRLSDSQPASSELPSQIAESGTSRSSSSASLTQANTANRLYFCFGCKSIFLTESALSSHKLTCPT